MTHEFTCSVCGEHNTHDSDFSTGYGTDRDGNKVCFECCGKQDSAELMSLPIGGKMCLYLSMDKGKEYFVSNWPGTFKIHIHSVRKGRHNMAGNRYDVWFDYFGNSYHGTQYGDNTQICHIRRIAS